MAYKQIDPYMTFADLALEKIGGKRQKQNTEFFKELDSTIDWKPVDKLLIIIRR